MTKSHYFLLLISLIIFITPSTGQNNRAQNEYSNKLVYDTIYSEILGEKRDVWVRYPENYNPERSTKYPVIYLLDGFSLQGSLEAVYNNYWGHYLPHSILIGISNRNNRRRDLTISQITNRRGGTVNFQTGGAEKFYSFIEKELIPHLDDNYPVTTYRTLIGHSYAGLFALHVLLNHNEAFKNYIAIDPSIDWDDQKLLKDAKNALNNMDFTGKSLFVSMAAEQLHMMDESVTVDNLMQDTTEFTLFPRSIVAFSELAGNSKENGLNFSWEVYSEDLHGTVPLPSMREGLIFLFKWYQFKNPQTYNNPETSVAEIKQLLDNQEKIYTEQFGYDSPPMIEEMLTGYGYMNIQMGQPEKSKMFFQKGLKHFPKSAAAYEGMADYYLSQKDNSNALKYISMAYKMDGSEYYKNRIKEIEGEK